MTGAASALDEPGGQGTAAAGIKAVPVRHPGRWVGATVVAAALVGLVYSLLTTEGYHWSVVGTYLTDQNVINGLVETLKLTAISMAIGVVLGTVLAVMGLSPNPLISGVAWLYIWFFRGTPVLVQILGWAFVAAIYPTLTIGIPHGPALWSGSANDVITLFMAAILGLGLNEAAYMAEIVRAGMISVDQGQTEASLALGLTHTQTLRRIVLPQAMRVIIPPTGNETISMLKTTSLVSVIAYTELLQAVKNIYSSPGSSGANQVIPLLIVASLWYLLFTSVLTAGQFYVERHFGRGSTRGQPATPLQRLRTLLGLRRPAVPTATAATPGAAPQVPGASGEGR